MDIPTTGPFIACKPYLTPLKDQKSVDEEIQFLEETGCISKSLSPWAAPVIVLPKNQILHIQTSNTYAWS